MSKAEEYIIGCTRNCSNEYLADSKPDGLGGCISRRKFTPWLSPDQARKAVEIAREEIYKWLKEHSSEYVYYWMDEESGEDDLINDLKQAMKDE